jgi:hypothetical protein
MASVTSLPADRQELQARLEEAGAVILAIPISTMPRGFTSNMPDYVRDYSEAYGYEIARLNMWRPNSKQIERMDEAFAWVNLITGSKPNCDPTKPDGAATRRRVIHLRMMVKPLSWYNDPTDPQYMFSWSKIGRLMGADRRAIHLWHSQALDMVWTLLQEKCADRK